MKKIWIRINVAGLKPEQVVGIRKEIEHCFEFSSIFKPEVECVSSVGDSRIFISAAAAGAPSIEPRELAAIRSMLTFYDMSWRQEHGKRHRSGLTERLAIG